MATVREVYQYLDGLAPFSLQMSFDNAGFLVGRGSAQVTRILVSLDITEEVAAEAVELGAELIVSHHPVIFHPAKSITDATPDGRILLALTEGKIAAICAHTNLDAVAGGVNDALAQRLGLVQVEQLHQDGVDAAGRPYGIGRVGNTTGAPSYAPAFAAFVKEALGSNGVRYVDARRPVRRVAVGGGACAGMLGDALALGCDTFVTSDVKYNGFLDAKALGMNLIDAGHYPTEQVVCPVLADWLSRGFPRWRFCPPGGIKKHFLICKGLPSGPGSDKLFPLIFNTEGERDSMSGHSKWHNIQKTKGAADAKREMIVAVKTGGSGDPANNSRLATVIAKAKAANMPNDNIKRTIDKALGSGNADAYENVTYEGYGPSGVAVIVDALTDNRNRTAPEVRHLLDKYGKGLGATGCVSWSFDRKGVIVIEKEDLDEDTVMMDALDAGADDMQVEDEVFEVYTSPDAFGGVLAALEEKGYTFVQAAVEMVPQNYVKLESEEDIKNMEKLIDLLEDNDDVQNVWHNWDQD